jgi:hypothetical protein
MSVSVKFDTVNLEFVCTQSITTFLNMSILAQTFVYNTFFKGMEFWSVCLRNFHVFLSKLTRMCLLAICEKIHPKRSHFSVIQRQSIPRSEFVYKLNATFSEYSPFRRLDVWRAKLERRQLKLRHLVWGPMYIGRRWYTTWCLITANLLINKLYNTSSWIDLRNS